MCDYCNKHGLTARGSDFSKTSSDICASCGTNMAKEAAKRAQRAAEIAARPNPWGASLPRNFATAGIVVRGGGGGGGGGGFGLSNRAISHTPSVTAGWLPAWLVAAARSRGFSFDNPRGAQEPAASSRNVSAAVGAMWRRAMPQSSCWHIHAQCRIVAFDIFSAPASSSSSSSASSSSSRSLGAPAGACYFDTNNMYIPCVCVDDAYRRRGLGSLLVVAAVALCESVACTVTAAGPLAVVSGAQPNLTVSRKDIERQPHLHDFYERLGFFGGRAGLGGNYVLDDAAAARMLRKYSALGTTGAAAADVEKPKKQGDASTGGDGGGV